MTARTLVAIMVATALSGGGAAAQQPANDLPNPYTTIENHFKLPAGRTWGSTSAIDISPDGQFIWVAERCGANSCFDRAAGAMSQLPVILKFDLNGNLVSSFASGMLVFPHGIHVDRQGNVWVTDGQDNGPAPARGGGRGAPPGAGGAVAADGGHLHSRIGQPRSAIKSSSSVPMASCS